VLVAVAMVVYKTISQFVLFSPIEIFTYPNRSNEEEEEKDRNKKKRMA
jgi:hypothetical protein